MRSTFTAEPIPLGDHNRATMALNALPLAPSGAVCVVDYYGELSDDGVNWRRQPALAGTSPTTGTTQCVARVRGALLRFTVTVQGGALRGDAAAVSVGLQVFLDRA